MASRSTTTSASNVVSLLNVARQKTVYFEPIVFELEASSHAWTEKHLTVVRLAKLIAEMNPASFVDMMSRTGPEIVDLIEKLDRTGQHLTGLTEVLGIVRQRLVAAIPAGIAA